MGSNDYWHQQADAWAIGAEGEPVTLLLPGGAERAVAAIVDRLSETLMYVQVRNSAVDGLSADEAQRYGGARVRLPKNPGRSDPTTLALFVPSHEELGRPWADAGMCTYRLGNHPQQHHNG